MKKNKHNIETGSNIERSDERIKETQEVFTPRELVELMIDEIDVSLLKDSSSKFIDNCAGSGNFLIGLKERLCLYGVDVDYPYERREIANWFARGKRTSPKTNEELPHTMLVPNRDLKAMCQDFLDEVRQFEAAGGRTE